MALAQQGPGPHLAAVEDTLLAALSDPELAETAAAALASAGVPSTAGRLALSAAAGGEVSEAE